MLNRFFSPRVDGIACGGGFFYNCGMSKDLGRLVIHGARGSWSVSGRAYQRHGGHTSCFSLERSDGLLIIDAGSGLAQLGRLLERRATLPPMTLLLTHVHLDHIIGLPAFRPLYRRDAQLTLLIEPSWRPVLERLVSPPLWPVALAGCSRRAEIVALVERRATC